MQLLSLQAFRDELVKIAVFERLIRLGATDIPKTPRLFMRKRSPKELAALQRKVEAGYDKRVTKPIMKKVEPLVSRLPKKIQPAARKGAGWLAEDPVGTVATNLVPVPGVHPAYLAGKKGLEKVIDKLAPIAKE